MNNFHLLDGIQVNGPNFRCDLQERTLERLAPESEPCGEIGCSFRQYEHRLDEVNVDDAASVLLTEFRVLGVGDLDVLVALVSLS